MAGELFYVYRYFVVDTGQITLTNSGVSGAQLMKNILQECQETKKLAAKVKGQEHLLLFQTKYSDTVALYKFTKRIPKVKFQLDEEQTDIIETTEPDFPYIYIIIDTKQQIVLMTHKYLLFQKREPAKLALVEFFSKLMIDSSYALSMDEIVGSNNFWKQIEDTNEIYEVSLNMRSPNLFGGIFETNDFLKRLKEAFNNSETQMKLKNEQGALNVTPDNLSDPLEYIENGGGNWTARIIKKGSSKKTTISSKTGIKTVEISNFENEYTFEGTSSEVIDTLEQLNTLADKDAIKN